MNMAMTETPKGATLMFGVKFVLLVVGILPILWAVAALFGGWTIILVPFLLAAGLPILYWSSRVARVRAIEGGDFELDLISSRATLPRERIRKVAFLRDGWQYGRSILIFYTGETFLRVPAPYVVVHEPGNGIADALSSGNIPVSKLRG